MAKLSNGKRDSFIRMREAWNIFFTGLTKSCNSAFCAHKVSATLVLAMGCSSQFASSVATYQYAKNVKSTKEIKCNQYKRSIVAIILPKSTLCSIHISKNKLGNIQASFPLTTYHVMNVPKGTYHAQFHVTYTHNRYNMFKTWITWIQIVINYPKVKTNGAKSKLWKKLQLYFHIGAFNFFGQLYNFLCMLNKRLMLV